MGWQRCFAVAFSCDVEMTDLHRSTSSRCSTVPEGAGDLVTMCSPTSSTILHAVDGRGGRAHIFQPESQRALRRILRLLRRSNVAPSPFPL